MASPPIPPANYNASFLGFGTLNGRMPADLEGPRVMPLQLDFSAATSYLLDLKIAQQQARLSFAQTVYIDNSLNASPVTIQDQMTLQRVTISPGYQAFIPVLSPVPPVYVVSSNGGVIVPVFLMNFPVSPASWPTSAPALTVTGGKLIVSDTALDALIGNWNGFGNALAVADLGLQDVLGPATPFSLIAPSGTPVGLITNAAGIFTHVEAFNNAATVAYLKLYDTATAPTAGAGTPIWRTLIPGNAAGAGFVSPIPPAGIKVVNGLGYAITGGIADADTTAIAANEFLINIGWKNT